MQGFRPCIALFARMDPSSTTAPSRRRGRPARYATGEERLEAQRRQKRESYRKRRTRELEESD